MKLKDLSWIFTAGVLAVLFSIISLLSYLFIEKGLLLIIAGITIALCFAKFLTGVLF